MSLNISAHLIPLKFFLKQQYVQHIKQHEEKRRKSMKSASDKLEIVLKINIYNNDLDQNNL